jgi:hypothetical protein
VDAVEVARQLIPAVRAADVELGRLAEGRLETAERAVVLMLDDEQVRDPAHSSGR